MKFKKMHGLGNDYLFINGFQEGEDHDWADLARRMSDRHFGVGSDGIILILPSDKAAFRMRIFNADGSEAEMCGNGMRCFARYVYEEGMTGDIEFDVETGAGLIRPRLILENGKVKAVRVNMGPPRFAAEDIPVRAEGEVVDSPLLAGGKTFLVTAVSMGNPHCVVFLDDLDGLSLEVSGPALERNPMFPKGANVEFVKVMDREFARMIVWERGSGATMACGTGACAVLAAGVRTGRLNPSAIINLPGGDLMVEWAADGNIYMTGPAVAVCDGVFLGAE
ncbi:MAG: diaminopimelate epimerase [Bacillota bacterium]